MELDFVGRIVTEEEKVLWAEYRQALRDLPETYPNSEDIVWPSKPEPVVVFVEPEPVVVTEESVVTFNEPIVEEPVIDFGVTSGSTGTTVVFGDTTSSFGSNTTSVFS